MNAVSKTKIGTLARAYWQPLVVLVLLLLALSQLYSWGSTYIELKKVDSLIAKTEQTHPSEKESSSEEDDSNKRTQKKEDNKPERNIFKRESIPYKLTGIFMETAIIDGKYVKEGDRVGKAIVKHIDIFSVQILEDGKTEPRTISMFQSKGGGGGRRFQSNRGRRSSSPSRNPSRTSSPSSNSERRETVRNNESGGDVFTKIRNMSPEDRRQYFQSLSPEQRERLRAQARERFGVRQGGGGPIRRGR